MNGPGVKLGALALSVSYSDDPRHNKATKWNGVTEFESLTGHVHKYNNPTIQKVIQ